MFPISTIRKYLARRKERKDNVRFLKCPSCGRKFWGHLPTSQHCVAFHAHCPRCAALVDEQNIIESRRQKVGRWIGAIGAAAWAVVKYPVQPFAANSKIVRLEARVVDEVARVEAKVDQQGQMIIKRLDVQDQALAGIGGMIAGIKGDSDLFVSVMPQIFPHPLDNVPIGSLCSIGQFQGRSNCKAEVVAHRILFDTVDHDLSRINDEEFFATFNGKSSAEAEFDGSYTLCSDSRIFICKRILLSVVSTGLTKAEANEILTMSSFYLEMMCSTKLRCSLKDIYDGRANIAGVVIQGGRSTRVRSSIRPIFTGRSVKLRLSIEGIECFWPIT